MHPIGRMIDSIQFWPSDDSIHSWISTRSDSQTFIVSINEMKSEIQKRM